MGTTSPIPETRADRVVRSFVNLTNGLQAVRDYRLRDYRMMRLQSTHCEQKRWGDVLASVPDEMLWRLALGDECRVYDYGANKDVPRAVWQGLEWVKYVLHRRWRGKSYQPVGRAKLCGSYFAAGYSKLGNRVLARLDYFGGIAVCDPCITSVTSSTTHDGDKKWLVACAVGSASDP